MTNRSHPPFTLLTAWLLATSLHAGDGVLDLTRPVNYSAQAIPDYIQRDNTPGGANPNPITNMGATLGRVLFYDKRLSRGSDQQLNGPYMHDGSLTTLAAVINHYVAPPNNANLDPRLQRPPLNLNTQQRNDLVAFLRTLAGNAVYTDPKWSDPFNAQNQLSLIVISIADSLIHRAPGSSVTLSSKGAPGLTYRLESTTQPGTNWTLVTTLTADAAGTLQHTLGTTSTPTFYRFTYTPPAP